jgi:hypothetical protein
MGFGKHNNCGAERVCLPLDALKESIEGSGASLKSIRLGPKSVGLQYVCPECDAYALGIDSENPTPFMCADGVVRTASDFDWNSKGWQPQSVRRGGFCFSPSAFSSISKLLSGAREIPDSQ